MPVKDLIAAKGWFYRVFSGWAGVGGLFLHRDLGGGAGNFHADEGQYISASTAASRADCATSSNDSSFGFGLGDGKFEPAVECLMVKIRRLPAGFKKWPSGLMIR
jgi:hypothetical protein